MEKVKLQAQYGLYINGEWRNASDGATYNAESPADGSHLQFAPKAAVRM